MSIRLTSRVYELELDARLQRVLLILCDHANDEGVCWPSLDRMAWALGLNERTIRRAVDDLESRGVIKIERHVGRSNVYHINLDDLPEKPSFKGRNPGQNVRTSDNEAQDKKSTLQEGKRGQNVQATPDILSESAGQNVHLTIEPSKEPSSPSINFDPTLSVVKNDDAPVRAKKPKGDPRVNEIKRAFCQAAGIPDVTSHDIAGRQAKQLLAAGFTPEDMPKIVAWLRKQTWMTGGFDLGTVLKFADKWRSSQAVEARKIQRYVV